MKIALVTADYPPDKGGVARYLWNLVQAAQGNIQVIKIELKKTSLSWLPLIGRLRRLRGEGFDLVLISQVLPVGTAAWIARIFGGLEYVIVIHGLDLRLAQLSNRKRWLARQVLRGARLVVANSEFVAAEICKFDPRLEPKVLTPGVEPISFPTHESARQSLKVSDQEFIILTIARLVPRKGIDTMLHVMPSLPSNVRYVVIGNGSDRQRLANLSQNIGGRVTFISDATDEERNRWFSAADLFVFLARDENADVEGFGIVCLEAAAAGLAILAGRSGGVSEAVVNRMTGYLVNPTGEQEIIEKIKILIEHPEDRRNLGLSGQERARRDFSWSYRWQLLQSWL